MKRFLPSQQFLESKFCIVSCDQIRRTRGKSSEWCLRTLSRRPTPHQQIPNIFLSGFRFLLDLISFSGWGRIGLLAYKLSGFGLGIPHPPHPGAEITCANSTCANSLAFHLLGLASYWACQEKGTGPGAPDRDGAVPLSWPWPGLAPSPSGQGWPRQRPVTGNAQ
jgi:hypothetical protein